MGAQQDVLLDDPSTSPVRGLPDQPPRLDQPRRPRHAAAIVLAGCVGILIGVAVAAMLSAALGRRATVVMTTGAPFTMTGPSTPERDLAAVITALEPSVVAISVASPGETDIGSGVVVRSDGMVLTAAHVIRNAGTITVTLADGRKSGAHIVGQEPSNDLAVVQADRFRHLSPATFGSVRKLAVGSVVLVIGNPLGFAGTVTQGIVSAVNRSVPVDGDPARPPTDPLLGLPQPATPTRLIHHAIQTDAVINPGNSGGPLIDMRGHVIGILATVATNNAGPDVDTGMGFAIPSDLAWPTANRLMANA